MLRWKLWLLHEARSFFLSKKFARSHQPSFLCFPSKNLLVVFHTISFACSYMREQSKQEIEENRAANRSIRIVIYYCAEGSGVAAHTSGFACLKNDTVTKCVFSTQIFFVLLWSLFLFIGRMTRTMGGDTMKRATQ